MLQEIIEEVGRRVGRIDGKFAMFNDKRYSSVEFSENNYQEIKDNSDDALVFIDGGNAELVNVPGLSLQIIRNAAVVLQENRLIESKKRDFYVLATTTDKLTQARIFGEEEEIVETELDPVKFCETIRRASELKLAIDELDKETVVLDGTLEAQNEIERNHLDELRLQTISKKARVVAVAKTTSLRTDTGKSFAALLNQRDGSWQYHPVVDINSDYHRAEMFFVKLHEKSDHVFRVEMFKDQKNEIAKIAGALKNNSKELTFPGYPYGLVLADKIARISNEEANLIKTKLFAAAGSKWKNIKKGLAAVDAHQILDNM